ncbi:YpmS family protein [Sporosarcina saromensis]|uniref:YpmS family protein n=1 Tax=Sporosarcina saromensis TaxID=359365 RepID=A0ABU4GDT6_9BACL|nr:YpmS family protein [Sporosarcina saromensis]MDW0113737.1 YpmS family protein [Sporosarcina saromensis]
MNRWKIAFFTLIGLLCAGVIALILFLDTSGKSEPLPTADRSASKGSVLLVKASRDDVEVLANNYLRKAMKGKPLPVTIEVKDELVLYSELTVFGVTAPIYMNFDPVVLEDGNLILKQSSMEIANLNIPPATVLKVLRDSIDLPEWMIVRPKEEEIFIDLSELPVSGNLQVRAKTFNLAEDEIELEVTIPNN